MSKPISSASPVEPITCFPLADNLLYPTSETPNKVAKRLPESSALTVQPILDEDGKPIAVSVGFSGVCVGVLDFNEVLQLSQWLCNAMKTEGGAPC